MNHNTQKAVARLMILIGCIVLTFSLSTYISYRKVDERWAEIAHGYDNQIENPEMILTNKVIKELYLEFKGFKPSGHAYSGWNAQLPWLGFSMILIGAGSWGLFETHRRPTKLNPEHGNHDEL